MRDLVSIASAQADLVLESLGEDVLFADEDLSHAKNFAHSEKSHKPFFAICVGTNPRRLSQTANMTDAQWFARDWRKERGRTLESVADELGTSVGYLSDMEKGRRRHNSDWAERLARVYEIAAQDLYRHPDQAVAGVTTDSVPVVGLVGAGSVATLFAEGQGPLDYVEPPQNATPHTVALHVKGTSLGPAWDESIIYYDDVRSPVTPDLHGRLCVVGLPDGRVLVKILKAAGDGTFHLLSNSLEEPLLNEEVLWAARVKAAHPR